VLTKNLLCVVVLAVFWFAGLVERSRAQNIGGYIREDLAKGRVAQVLNEMETNAVEAGKRQNWDKAALSYLRASMAARFSGQLQKAVLYSNKGFEAAEKGRDPLLQAHATRFLALALRDLRQTGKAVEWLEKGKEIARQIPPGTDKESLEGQLYRELGFLLLLVGKNQEGIQDITYALQILESRLSFIRRRAGRGPYALANAQEQVISTLAFLADAHRLAGKPEEAIKSYNKGLEMIKQGDLKLPVEANLYQGLGHVYLHEKDFAMAVENLQRALQMAEKLDNRNLVRLASSGMGDLSVQTQKPVEAIGYYKKAIESVESTRSLLESEEFRSSFFEDKGQTYIGMVEAQLQAGNPEEAFNYNERARSRAFLDILGGKAQLSRASGGFVDEERALRERIAGLRAKTTVSEQGTDEGGEAQRTLLRRELEEAEKSYNAFLANVRKQDKEQASLMNVEPLTLRQLQELLEPGVTVLEYFVPTSKAMLWVVDRDRANFVRLSLDRSELISKVSVLRESINQVGEQTKFKQASEELYRALIEPALPHIRGKELLIIPHDVLHYLPYQALFSPQGKYLIQGYPIYYLSSASLMQFTREKKKATREKALVMGNPDLGDQAYNLRFAEREAKEIARLYPQSAVYLRAEATKPRAISLSPNYDILHFAVHGELRRDDPLNSGLLLAEDGKEDGRLRVGEIFSLNLKADTVVLSACESGLGKITSGDEIIGLTRSFIYAGTPSIVTTLWKVNDRTSYELMREFYSNLRTMKKSEALRQAQLKTMQEFPHPFFWAAYGLTGEP
jgi:CHAT domain-containing protein